MKNFIFLVVLLLIATTAYTENSSNCSIERKKIVFSPHFYIEEIISTLTPENCENINNLVDDLLKLIESTIETPLSILYDPAPYISLDKIKKINSYMKELHAQISKEEQLMVSKNLDTPLKIKPCLLEKFISESKAMFKHQGFEVTEDEINGFINSAMQEAIIECKETRVKPAISILHQLADSYQKTPQYLLDHQESYTFSNNSILFNSTLEEQNYVKLKEKNSEEIASKLLELKKLL